MAMTAVRTIAVVIPTLDEADRVARAVASALAAGAPPASGPGPLPRATEHESARTSGREIGQERRRESGEVPIRPDVVVVDGGSRDDTVERARRAGARVLDSPRGRGRQLDRGWRATPAEIVLFLHADTMLPMGWSEAVIDAMEDETVSGGAFRFEFDARGEGSKGLGWRVLELGVALRVTLFGLPYGDQALFCRRAVLEGAGGVPDVAILEDLDLVRLIKRAGRLRMLPLRVRTSPRRHRHGVVATISRHALALAGFFLGVDRGWIARRVRG